MFQHFSWLADFIDHWRNYSICNGPTSLNRNIEHWPSVHAKKPPKVQWQCWQNKCLLALPIDWHNCNTATNLYHGMNPTSPGETNSDCLNTCQFPVRVPCIPLVPEVKSRNLPSLPESACPDLFLSRSRPRAAVSPVRAAVSPHPQLLLLSTHKCYVTWRASAQDFGPKF